MVPATPSVVADLPSTIYVIEQVFGFACELLLFAASWPAFAAPLFAAFCAVLDAPEAAALPAFFEVEAEFVASAAFAFSEVFPAFAVAAESL